MTSTEIKTIELIVNSEQARKRLDELNIKLDQLKTKREEALERAAQADKALLFYENEHAVTLRMALEEGSWSTASLLTGPEGGLEEAEVEQARKAGFQVCTLGKRILRCETAPLCALSAVMYAAGEF